MRTHLRTVAAAVRLESDPVKGSRFLADVRPVATRAEAEAELAAVRAEFPDATHHCSAWRIDPEGHEERADDDGEPNNSAGAPILRSIQGRELAGVLVVVTRWYGGTKLGVGGLIRAYGAAAGRALDAAEPVERPVRVALRLCYPYPVSSAVEALLARHAGREEGAEFGAEVRRDVSVPLAALEAFVAELGEAAAGRVAIERRAADGTGDPHRGAGGPAS